jgi:two-component system, chemotaxis family, CheB/CheR fusion protein
MAGYTRSPARTTSWLMRAGRVATCASSCDGRWSRIAAGERIRVNGPELTLRAQAGVALIMILHELATNAAKYGALSTPNGTLDVNWQHEDGGGRPQIRLRWIEAGGPPVKAPTRRGFGSELIERSTTHELHGQAILDYREEGLHGELTFPWNESSPLGESEA